MNNDMNLTAVIAVGLATIYQNHGAEWEIPDSFQLLHTLDVISVEDDAAYEQIGKALRAYEIATAMHIADHKSAVVESKYLVTEELGLGLGGFAFGLPLTECALHLGRAAYLAMTSESRRALIYQRTPFHETPKGREQFKALRADVDHLLDYCGQLQ